TRTVGKFVKFHGRLLSHSLSWPGSSRPIRVLDACKRENADPRPKAAHDELFLLVLVHAHEVVHFCDHAAGRWRIPNFLDASDAIETQPDQRLPLAMVTADRTAGLFDFDRFSALAHWHWLPPIQMSQS